MGGGSAAGKLAEFVDEVGLVVVAAIERQAGQRPGHGAGRVRAACGEAPESVPEAQHAGQKLGRECRSFEAHTAHLPRAEAGMGRQAVDGENAVPPLHPGQGTLDRAGFGRSGKCQFHS